MSDLLSIQQYLSSKGLRMLSPVSISPTSNTLVIEVPRDKIKETASGAYTSRRQLTFVARSLQRKFGYRVIVSVRDAQALDDIAVALRAVLTRSFTSDVRDVLVSFPAAEHAVVWVEASNILDSQRAGAIEQVARSTLLEFGIVCDAFQLVAPILPEPSTIAILRSVKVLAPVVAPDIYADLIRRGFSCPSENWLSFKLDSARKRGLLLRDPAGRFVLTGDGLDVVPRTRSASSSDVDRVLALARRKGW